MGKTAKESISFYCWQTGEFHNPACEHADCHGQRESAALHESVAKCGKQENRHADDPDWVEETSTGGCRCMHCTRSAWSWTAIEHEMGCPVESQSDHQPIAEAHPEPRTVEEALALVTGGPDDYCDPKDQPEPERGTAERVRAILEYANRVCSGEDQVAEDDTEALNFVGRLVDDALHLLAPSPLPVREQSDADELLAEVMHLWTDGYISKNPNSCADASISNETFAKISAHLDNVGIEVDYSGWHRRAIAGEKE